MAYPTTTEEIGGKGGNPFSFTGEKNGASLEKIWVREGEHEIKGVKVWLSDGRIEAFGKQSGSHEEYVFSPGECFTSLSLWGNGKGTHLGAIKFKTNKGGKFVAKMTGRDLKKEFPIDVGSGFCLGVVGRSSSEINSMGFMFLNAVESAVLTDISYPTINQLMPNVETEEIKSITLENDSFVKQVKTVETSKKVIKTSSWSITKSFSSTFSMEVKAGIPELFEVSTGLSVSVGMENTHGLEQTIEKNETFSSAVEIPPQKKMKVKMTIGRANFDLPYTGTVKITCKNGSVLEYQTKGQYKGVSYTEYKVNTTESDL